MLRNLFSLNFIYILLIAAEAAAVAAVCWLLPAYVPATIFFAVLWLLGVIASVAVYCRGSSPEINCSVILMITALPLAGALLYLLSTVRTNNRGKLSVTGSTFATGEERAVNALCGTGGAGYDRAVYFKCGEEYFNLLFKEIRAAKESVYLEYFIVRRGVVFNNLISAVRAAKRNGAEILILIDGIGSAFKIGRREFKALRSAGAEVKTFHRLKPLFYTGLNNRDHRKIAVVDGKAAFTGGFNIGDEYANADSPYGYWKDTGVAVYGAAAEVFKGMFLSVWNKGYTLEAKDGGSFRCIPFYDSPPHTAKVAENIYLSAICRAKERIHVFTPYLCAGEKLNSALSYAALRGVDVRIIIPHIPDKKYAYALTRDNAAALIDAGVKIYEYTPGFMHAKSMVCDDRVFIGTYNLDLRSFKLNFECGVAFDGEMCRIAERDFWDCARLSSPFVQEKLSPFKRAYVFFLKLFAPLF